MTNEVNLAQIRARWTSDFARQQHHRMTARYGPEAHPAQAFEDIPALLAAIQVRDERVKALEGALQAIEQASAEDRLERYDGELSYRYALPEHDTEEIHRLARAALTASVEETT